MKKAACVYVLTLNSSSRTNLRLWTGKSLYALRHCSAKQIGLALAEMQRSVEDLQKRVRTTHTPRRIPSTARDNVNRSHASG